MLQENKIYSTEELKKELNIPLKQWNTRREELLNYFHLFFNYEIIVEGGYTRYMAIYKDQETEKIGSVRSARHYFLDYALENDAVYIHWGYSPQASKEMESYHVDHFDGIKYENKYFFRDRTLKRDYEHTGFTSMENVKEYAQKQGYTRDTNKDLILNEMHLRNQYKLVRNKALLVGLLIIQ